MARPALKDLMKDVLKDVLNRANWGRVLSIGDVSQVHIENDKSGDLIVVVKTKGGDRRYRVAVTEQRGTNDRAERQRRRQRDLARHRLERTDKVQQIHTPDKDTIDYYTEVRRIAVPGQLQPSFQVWVTFGGDHSVQVYETHAKLAAEGVKGFLENNAPMVYDWYFRLMSPDLMPEVTFGIDDEGDRTT